MRVGEVHSGTVPTQDFFTRPVAEVAAALIGAVICVSGVGGIIVETEAYARDDPASHSFKGETHRNRAMFGQAGSVYVYRSYGIHWCVNIVCNTGCAVLIRALQPKYGIEIMYGRRATQDHRLLCSGPGRVGQALAVDAGMNGLIATRAPFHLAVAPGSLSHSCSSRIGISKATETLWRFSAVGSQYLSRRS